MEQRSPTLLEKTREVLRLKHYSPKTEVSYVHWIRQLIRFYKPRHPRDLNSADIISKCYSERQFAETCRQGGREKATQLSESAAGRNRLPLRPGGFMLPI